MLGQRMSDNPLGVPSTEFWNRSIQKVWSVDGIGPGPGAHADARPAGRRRHACRLTRTPTSCSRPTASRSSARRSPRTPTQTPRSSASTARSASARTRPGSPPTDGSSATRATRPCPRAPRYNQFDVSAGGKGNAVLTLSRETFCPSGVRPPGRRPGPDRRARARPRQAAGDRARDGLGDGLRPRLRDAGRSSSRRPTGRGAPRSQIDTFVPARGRPGDERQRASRARRTRRRSTSSG